MIKGEFEYIIASLVDEEELVCEIYYKNELISELTFIKDTLYTRIYPADLGFYWELPCEELLQAFEIGRNYLLDEKID